jgi:predicted DNA-binding transcriptional regulator AlpA
VRKSAKSKSDRAGAASDSDDEQRAREAARRAREAARRRQAEERRAREGDRRARDAARRREARERRAAMRRTLPGDPDARLNPFVIFRPQRLADLLDVDRTCIWRWRQNGTLPPPVEIAGIKGWTWAQIEHLFAQRSAGRGAGTAS